MDDAVRNEILAMSRSAHAWTEAAYQQDPSKRGDPGWAGKQSILLADMALHLLQTSLRPGGISESDLKRNLFSILTISDQFLDHYDLKRVADELYAS